MFILLWAVPPAWAGWTMTVDVLSQGGQPYVPLVRIVRSLGLTYEVVPTALHFRYRNRDISITNGQVMVVGDQFIPLSVVPYWQGRELWVPLDTVQKIFVVQINWRLQTQEAVFTAAEDP
jgi:hypothetical protein